MDGVFVCVCVCFTPFVQTIVIVILTLFLFGVESVVQLGWLLLSGIVRLGSEHLSEHWTRIFNLFPPPEILPATWPTLHNVLRTLHTTLLYAVDERVLRFLTAEVNVPSPNSTPPPSFFTSSQLRTLIRTLNTTLYRIISSICLCLHITLFSWVS
jgi:hypothetical protein